MGQNVRLTNAYSLMLASMIMKAHGSYCSCRPGLEKWRSAIGWKMARTCGIFLIWIYFVFFWLGNFLIGTNTFLVGTYSIFRLLYISFWFKINLIGSIVLRMVRFLFSSVRSHWINYSIVSINYCQITGIIAGYSTSELNKKSTTTSSVIKYILFILFYLYFIIFTFFLI